MENIEKTETVTTDKPIIQEDLMSYTLGRQTAIITYVLYLCSCLLPPLAWIAIILSYVNRKNKYEDFKIGDKTISGDILNTHFKKQIRVFWFAFLWIIISLFLCLIAIGYIGLIIVGIWQIYMYVKGLIKVMDNKAF